MTLVWHSPDLRTGFRNAARLVGDQVGNAGRHRAFGHEQLHLGHADLTIGLAAGEGFRRAKPDADNVSDVLDLANVGDEDFWDGGRLGDRPSCCCAHDVRLQHGYAAHTGRALPLIIHRQPEIVPSVKTLNFYPLSIAEGGR